MNLDEDLLSVLRCPETKQRLRRASEEEIQAINAARGDQPHLEGALVREDGRRAYPIDDGYPVLLLEEAIEL